MSRRSPIIPLLIAVPLLGMFSAQSSRAADSSDIPGVPLPGPIVSGQLGGPVYDVVYRFQVQAGYVLVAALSGSAGTDFDMYVFDGTATSVVQPEGLLAKSTGPTSSELLSYVLRNAGVYYIDLNGATNVIGTFRLTVQIVPDTTRPAITGMSLDGGKSSTGNPAVTVWLNAFDDLSGVAEMAFSDNGTNYGPWEPYADTASWVFEPGDGTKTLWAKVRNGVGLESLPASDRIVIDTTPPGILSVVPPQNSTTTGLLPKISIRFTEPLDPASWTQAGIVVQSPSGEVVPGTSTYSQSGSTGTFVPIVPLSPGLAYAVTVGQVTDIAGNALPVLGSWTLTTRSPTALSVTPAPGVIQYGASTNLAIKTLNLDSAVVNVEGKLASSALEFAPVGSVVPTLGRAQLTVAPDSNTVYRALFAGSPTQAAAQSTDVRVIVRRSISLVGLAPGSSRLALRGRHIILSAQVGPIAAGARLSFRQFLYQASTRRYVYAGSRGRVSDQNGLATVDWITSPGRMYWEVVVLPSADYGNNISGKYFWTIR